MITKYLNHKVVEMVLRHCYKLQNTLLSISYYYSDAVRYKRHKLPQFSKPKGKESDRVKLVINKLFTIVTFTCAALKEIAKHRFYRALPTDAHAIRSHLPVMLILCQLSTHTTIIRAVSFSSSRILQVCSLNLRLYHTPSIHAQHRY